MASKLLAKAVFVVQATVGVRHDAEVEESLTSATQSQATWWGDSNEKQAGSYCCYEVSELTNREWIATSIGNSKPELMKKKCDLVAPQACPRFTTEDRFRGYDLEDPDSFQGFIAQGEMFEEAIEACKGSGKTSECETLQATKAVLFTKVKEIVERTLASEKIRINEKYSATIASKHDELDTAFNTFKENLDAEHSSKIDAYVQQQQEAFNTASANAMKIYEDELRLAQNTNNEARHEAMTAQENAVAEADGVLKRATEEAEAAFNTVQAAAEEKLKKTQTEFAETQSSEFKAFAAEAKEAHESVLNPKDEERKEKKAQAKSDIEAKLAEDLGKLDTFTTESINKWQPADLSAVELHRQKQAKCREGKDCCCLADLDHAGTWSAFKVPSNFAYGVCSDTADYKKSSIWQKFSFSGVECDNYFVNCKQCIAELCDENAHCERRDHKLVGGE